MEQFINIKLFGQPFSFKADAAQKNAQAAADQLVKEVNRVQVQYVESSTQISDLAIMILAALNISNKSFDQKERTAALIESLSKRSAAIVQRIDECMQQAVLS